VASSRLAVIAGVGETPMYRGAPVQPLSLMVDAARRACADAGVSLADVDGLIGTPDITTCEELSAHLGLGDLAFSPAVQFGGASAVAAVHLATSAIRAGEAECVLVVFGWDGYSAYRSGDLPGRSRRRLRLDGIDDTMRDLYAPYGARGAASLYAWLVNRYIHLHGEIESATARLAISGRANAVTHPDAVMRDPISLDDYLASRVVAAPMRTLDCCLETDTAAAVLVTSQHRADGHLRQRGVAVTAGSTGRPSPGDDLLNRADPFDLGLTRAAPRVFRDAATQAGDIDLLYIYDCFTPVVLFQIEALGLCERGQAAHWVVRHIGAEAEDPIPLNTHGGLLSHGHCWAMNHVVEAVHQLRGTADDRQIGGARTALVTGWGDFGDGSLITLEAS
jgi:acetyl-CoA acetyltransferase